MPLAIKSTSKSSVEATIAKEPVDRHINLESQEDDIGIVGYLQGDWRTRSAFAHRLRQGHLSRICRACGVRIKYLLQQKKKPLLGPETGAARVLPKESEMVHMSGGGEG